MRIRTVVILLLVLCCLCQSRVAHAQLLQLVVNSRLKPMPGSKFWGKTSSKDIVFPLHYHSHVKPTYLLIGRDHPNGIRFLAMFPGYGVKLPLKYEDRFNGFNDDGELKQGYYIQVAEHDFDHDGIPEIIVAIGDGSVDLSINIIKYHAPQSAQDADREANWSLIGSYWGQAKAEIRGDTIEIPIGSQGLYDEYTWVKGKFIKTE